MLYGAATLRFEQIVMQNRDERGMQQHETSSVLDLRRMPMVLARAFPTMFQSEKATSDDPLDGEALNGKPHHKEDNHQRRRHNRKSRRVHELGELQRRVGENALFTSQLLELFWKYRVGY